MEPEIWQLESNGPYRTTLRNTLYWLAALPSAEMLIALWHWQHIGPVPFLMELEQNYKIKWLKFSPIKWDCPSRPWYIICTVTDGVHVMVLMTLAIYLLEIENHGCSLFVYDLSFTPSFDQTWSAPRMADAEVSVALIPSIKRQWDFSISFWFIAENTFCGKCFLWQDNLHKWTPLSRYLKPKCSHQR